MADQETQTILKSWGMPEDIIKAFTEAGIDCVVLENMQESEWSALMPDMKQMGHRVKFRMCWQPWVANLRNRCSTPFSTSTSTVGDMTYSADLLISTPTITTHESTSYPIDFNSPPGGYIQPSTSSTGYNQDGIYNNFDPMASAGLGSSACNTPAIQSLPKAVSNNYVWFQNRRAKWRKAERLKEEQRKREDPDRALGMADLKTSPKMKDMEEQDLASSGGSEEEVEPEEPGLKMADRATTPISCGGATDNEEAEPVLSPGSNRPVTSSPGERHLASRTPLPPISAASIATSLASQHPLFSTFSSDSSVFRPVNMSTSDTRTSSSLFFPSHLGSHFSPPFFPSLKGFPGLCSCCPMKPFSNGLLNSPPSADSCGLEQRSSSVAELRRKAQEHSAALLHSLHAAAALNLPLGLPLPSLSSLHQALASRKPELESSATNSNSPPSAPHNGGTASPTNDSQ